MFEIYTSLPKKVKAVQFTEENKDMVFNCLCGQFSAFMEGDMPSIKVTTIHGEIAIVRIGDWIIKENRRGFYYPVKDRIFKSKYVPTAE